jgi:hypothetical protein
MMLHSLPALGRAAIVSNYAPADRLPLFATRAVTPAFDLRGADFTIASSDVKGGLADRLKRLSMSY